MEPEADYIVVGAGSAGCVLANRLSADPRHSVVLLEAGGDDRPLKNLRQFRSNLMIHVPVGFAEAMHDRRVTWPLKSEPVPGTVDRVHPVTRGKVLGGSSSINAMLYVRGEASDYEAWRQLGCQGWGWDEVLPLFRRSEHQERGEDAFHGVDGPLNVSDNRGFLDVSRRVLEAAAAAGIPTLPGARR
jgi:choline dehydrogenase